MALELTDANIAEALSKKELTVLDFWAPWCGPCKKVSPILDEISSEHGLWVGKLNVDENPVKSDEFGIKTIPTMVLFKSGQPVKTIIGAKPKHVMLEELSEWI